ERDWRRFVRGHRQNGAREEHARDPRSTGEDAFRGAGGDDGGSLPAAPRARGAAARPRSARAARARAPISVNQNHWGPSRARWGSAQRPGPNPSLYRAPIARFATGNTGRALLVGIR